MFILRRRRLSGRGLRFDTFCELISIISYVSCVLLSHVFLCLISPSLESSLCNAAREHTVSSCVRASKTEVGMNRVRCDRAQRN